MSGSGRAARLGCRARPREARRARSRPSARLPSALPSQTAPPERRVPLEQERRAGHAPEPLAEVEAGVAPILDIRREQIRVQAAQARGAPTDADAILALHLRGQNPHQLGRRVAGRRRGRGSPPSPRARAAWRLALPRQSQVAGLPAPPPVPRPDARPRARWRPSHRASCRPRRPVHHSGDGGAHAISRT